jgi:hypothetical protein
LSALKASQLTEWQRIGNQIATAFVFAPRLNEVVSANRRWMVLRASHRIGQRLAGGAWLGIVSLS